MSRRRFVSSSSSRIVSEPRGADEVGGSRPHRGHGLRLADGAGHDDERSLHDELLTDGERLGAGEGGHAEVRDDDVPGFLQRVRERVRRLDAPLEDDIVATGLQRPQDQRDVILVVFHEEDAQGRGHKIRLAAGLPIISANSQAGGTPTTFLS